MTKTLNIDCRGINNISSIATLPWLSVELYEADLSFLEDIPISDIIRNHCASTKDILDELDPDDIRDYCITNGLRDET